MADANKIVETIKFLLTSVKRLSDSYLNAEARLGRSFDQVGRDFDDVHERLRWLEARLVNLSDEELRARQPTAAPALPTTEDSADRVVPVLNLPVEAILEVYATTPVLLEPFSRPCSVSARTLSGEIEAMELDAFAQGTTWALETLDGGWLLIPRPGSLERRTQLQTLERMYSIEGLRQLPALLHLIRPARAEAVVHGRRWQMQEKGVLSVSPDPLRSGVADRLAALEQRLARLEERGG